MAHILVVDDERDVVTLMRFLLQKDGHRVTEAYNGAQALEKMGVEPAEEDAELPDLIVLDVMMPVMDGYTVCGRLEQNGRTRRIPLIVMTAKGQMRDLFEKASNVVACVEKPFDPQKLRQVIRDVLKS
ncbi:MAG: response regulator [Elusimicrobiota bacterium]